MNRAVLNRWGKASLLLSLPSPSSLPFSQMMRAVKVRFTESLETWRRHEKIKRMWRDVKSVSQTEMTQKLSPGVKAISCVVLFFIYSGFSVEKNEKKQRMEGGSWDDWTPLSPAGWLPERWDAACCSPPRLVPRTELWARSQTPERLAGIKNMQHISYNQIEA